MPRFTDEWVVTKSLFEYTTGGSCACCSFPAMFDPNGLKGLISSVSDLETDAAENEFKSAQSSPWPPEMRDSIWGDRVKVRYKMKKEMEGYKTFMDEVVGVTAGAASGDDVDVDDIDDEKFIRWFADELGAKSMRRIFQMPRSEVTDILSEKYGICPAYGTVMCTVVEQVANFGVTKYETDSRGKEEIMFEQMLKYNRRGGFILDVTNVTKKKNGDNMEGGGNGNQVEINIENLRMFISVMRSLGGPKLLHRRPRSLNIEHAETGEADESGNEDTKAKGGPSFRSDRRIIRLVIARYWADQIISKYKKSISNVTVEQKE
jgi:hypothetical protein